MFLLRCAFWLSIVYASMSWTPGTLAPGASGSDLMAAARSQAGSLVESAKTRLADYCMRHARECLDDAARLTSLVAASAATDRSEAGEPAFTVAIPLPAPDPRRHGRDAKLAPVP